MFIPFVLSFVVLVLLRYLFHDWSQKKSVTIAGPKPVPVLGNVLMYAGKNPYGKHFLQGGQYSRKITKNFIPNMFFLY